MMLQDYRHSTVEATYADAVRLARALLEKHWQDEAPHWQPLDTTQGVISQIDNMVSCLVRPVPGETALPRQHDRRISPDSAWPLRREDGTPFYVPREGRKL